MTIKALIDYIAPMHLEKIIEFYNKNKPITWMPLEQLHRSEGGFQICIPGMQHIACDINNKIKQLRWHNKKLVSYKFYETFTKEESELLFLSMNAVLGDDVINI